MASIVMRYDTLPFHFTATLTLDGNRNAKARLKPKVRIAYKKTPLRNSTKSANG